MTEIVDAGLLGEHIIPTLRHAWRELLITCEARGKGQTSNQTTLTGHVIPCGAVVHAMVIECPEIRRGSRLGTTLVPPNPPPSFYPSLSQSFIVDETNWYVLIVHRLVVNDVGGILVKPVSLEGSCKMESNCGRGVTSAKPSSSKELTKDPYTCERLTQIRGGYTPLTSPVPVLQFDFTNSEVWLYVEAGLTIVMIVE